MKKVDLSRYGFGWQTPFAFAKNSSIGCGGTAVGAFFPSAVDELIDLVYTLKKEGVPYMTLGNLTNVLPPDNESEKVVLSTKRMGGITVGERIFVSAGVQTATLLSACKRVGRTGAEFLVGIPCTIGGALYMNAGVSGKYIAEIVDEVLVLREGKKLALPLSACEYAYKQSAFMHTDDVILGAWLRLSSAAQAEIEVREREYLDKRRHLPKGRSMGCVFKNPTHIAVSAGALIEQSGLKGLRIGGAVVSKEHANFIINDRGATSADIRKLIEIIKEKVYLLQKIRLEEEIRYL